MKKEICVCDSCQSDLKEKDSFLEISISLTSYKGITFWDPQNVPVYAGEKHFCDIKCFKDFLRKSGFTK